MTEKRKTLLDIIIPIYSRFDLPKLCVVGLV